MSKKILGIVLLAVFGGLVGVLVTIYNRPVPNKDFPVTLPENHLTQAGQRLKIEPLAVTLENFNATPGAKKTFTEIETYLTDNPLGVAPGNKTFSQDTEVFLILKSDATAVEVFLQSETKQAPTVKYKLDLSTVREGYLSLGTNLPLGSYQVIIKTFDRVTILELLIK